MTNDDFDKFSGALTAALDVYGKTVSPMVINIWWKALESYDLRAVLHSLSKHIQNPDSGQYVPKPADIIRGIEGSTEDRALDAWAKVDKAVKYVGGYDSVAFDDPIIHLAITDMGGWIKICSGTVDEWPFIAKEFEKRYRNHLSKENKDFPKKLVGKAEMENSEGGYKIEPPVLVGDKTKAAQVFIDGGASSPIPFAPMLEIKTIK